MWKHSWWRKIVARETWAFWDKSFLKRKSLPALEQRRSSLNLNCLNIFNWGTKNLKAIIKFKKDTWITMIMENRFKMKKGCFPLWNSKKKNSHNLLCITIIRLKRPFPSSVRLQSRNSRSYEIYSQSQNCSEAYCWKILLVFNEKVCKQIAKR